LTPDSSAIVAAFAAWHPVHDRARRALRGVEDLVAHAELEAYSVLTRLPPPFRVEPALVSEYLRRRHPGARLVLPAAARTRLIDDLAQSAVSGGAVYDALIALTAQDNERVLVTCDERALSLYERLGVPVRAL